MRAQLHEMHGLHLLSGESRLPHPVDMRRWEDAGLISFDAETLQFSLTNDGRKAVANEGLPT